MSWFNNIIDCLKNIITLISRVMKLEERVSTLEKNIETIRLPPRDIKENLEYKKEWNYYVDKITGEEFCPVCIGNGKKITISRIKDSQVEGWHCQDCKANKYEYKSDSSTFPNDTPRY